MNFANYISTLILFIGLSCAPKGTAVKYTFQIDSPQVLTVEEVNEFSKQVLHRLSRGGYPEAIVKIENNQLFVEDVINLEKKSDAILKLLNHKKIEFWETFRMSDVNKEFSKEFLQSMPGFVPYSKINPLGKDEIIGLYTKQADTRTIKEKIEKEINRLDVKILFQKNIPGDRDHVINENNIYLINTRGSNIAPVSNKDITKATAQKSKHYPDINEIHIQLNKEGSTKWASITREAALERRKIVIAIDDEVIFAPIVRQEITGGKASISGKFSIDEAENLAIAIGLGEMSYRLRLIE